MTDTNKVATDRSSHSGLLHSPRLQRFLGGGLLERIGVAALRRIQIISMRPHKNWSDLAAINKVCSKRRSLLTGDEYYILGSLARGFAHREGDFIEVGTYQGASAKLMGQYKGAEKKLWVCDTYEGLPASHSKDRSVHRLKQYACSIESVGEFLKDIPNVQLVKGFFPQSTEGVIPDDVRFAIAHIDVDLYEGTLQGIKYLYERLIPGGIIISHDYSLLSGVKAAVNEFMAEHSEASMVELPTTQCMIIKP